MRIVIIGTGNTATVLGKSFIRAGHTIVQVIGRNKQRSEELAGILHSAFTTNTADTHTSADVYIIAVTDTAIIQIADWLRTDKKLVVHTAGSVEKDALRFCSKNYGVMYPLQSLRKEIDYLPEIPFLIDGNTDDNRTLIQDFAKTVSAKVVIADDKCRLMTHIGGVIASNFTNHLYAITQDYCKKQDIAFELLLPLINEVSGRLNHYPAQNMQTGPAVRNDSETIEKHISLLQPFPQQQSLYRYFTESIQRWHAVDPH